MRQLIMIIVCGFLSWQSAAHTLELRFDGKVVPLSLAELKQALPVKLVQIEDPVYHKTKRYQAFELAALLNRYQISLDATRHELVMTALDGYAPPVPISAVSRFPAYLAFAEEGKADFQFESVTLGKSTASPAPFYLIWQVDAKQAEQLPWPFQLVTIEKVDLAQQYAAMFPKTPSSTRSAAAVQRGFQLFRQQCVRCHSINLQGGVVGPELNAPKNVTEYWSDQHLRGLIRDASSYRYRSKMPAFPELSPQDIDDILQYLRQMATQKIKKPASVTAQP